MQQRSLPERSRFVAERLAALIRLPMGCMAFWNAGALANETMAQVLGGD